MKKEQNFIMKAVLFDWQNRLSSIFTALFLLQYVLWFSEYWLPETKWIVIYSLCIVLLIQLVPMINGLLRGVLQASACVWIVAAALGLPYEPIDWSSLGTFFESLKQFAASFAPYIWFTIAAWLAFQFTLWWVQAKVRIYFLIITSVVVFSIVDSFSRFVLWEQVALIVLSGLFLLVIRHFSDLKAKNPEGWSYLADYPGSIAFPIVALLTVTVALGAMAPEVNPTLMDPYTAWMRLKGEQVAVAGKGNGILPFEGDSSSGYSRNDQDLGGGFSFDYSPVMTVSTSHRSYWRGETRSFYNGKGWERSVLENGAATSAVTLQNELPSPAKSDKLKTVAVTQTVTILKDETYPVLFGAYSIEKLESVGDNAEQTISSLGWKAQHSELRWNERSDQPYPKTYTIVSQVPIVDEAGLRTAPSTPVNEQWNDYLQLPPNLPERVKQLAADITKDASNNYDKVKQIEQYLFNEFPYTNKPDTRKGKSNDFVDQFVFEIKEGYCDYYSTAMAVLTRSIGIPARWVKGYASGRLPIEDLSPSGLPETQQDGSGDYQVLNADAHSWVEVYFEGWGWIPFEPTSGFVLPSVQAEVKQVAEQQVTKPALPVEEAATTSPLSRPIIWAPAVIVLLLLLLFTLSKFGVIDFRNPFRKKRRDPDLNQKIVLEYERLLRYAKRRGLARYEFETVRETMNRWCSDNKWLLKDSETLLLLFEKAKYSPTSMTEEDVTKAYKTVEKIRESI